MSYALPSEVSELFPTTPDAEGVTQSRARSHKCGLICIDSQRWGGIKIAVECRQNREGWLPITRAWTTRSVTVACRMPVSRHWQSDQWQWHFGETQACMSSPSVMNCRLESSIAPARTRILAMTRPKCPEPSHSQVTLYVSAVRDALSENEWGIVYLAIVP